MVDCYASATELLSLRLVLGPDPVSPGTWPHHADAHDANPGLCLTRPPAQTPVSLVLDVAVAFYGPRWTEGTPEAQRVPQSPSLAISTGDRP